MASDFKVWRIYDRSMGLVAVEGGTEAQIREAYAKAPEIVRGDLVILAPGEPLPTNSTTEPSDAS